MAYKDKVSPQVQEAIFNQLLEKSGNTECADCNTKSPSWLSLDFGVFVCIRCSGIHRQYGQHITRVRSTRLDGLPKEYIEIMAATGNKLANQYYEHSLSKGFRKPTIGSSPEECKRFMDEKYIRKAYAPKGFPEPVKELIECRKNGTKPAFAFAKEREETKPVEKVEEAPVNHENHRKAGGILRKKSMSLDKLPEKHEQIDLMSNDVDLLGSGGDGNDFGDFKHAARSTSPPKEKKTINFANFKKAQETTSPQQTQPQASTNWAWDLTSAPANPQNPAPSAINSTTPVQNQAEQKAESKVDVMKLYSQPTQQMHQNHFMHGNMHGNMYPQQQQWHGHNMQGGYNNGWNNGGYNNNAHMGQFGGQAGFNNNMGYNNVHMNGTMAYNQAPMNGQFGNNMYQNNGYPQTAQNRYF